MFDKNKVVTLHGLIDGKPGGLIDSVALSNGAVPDFSGTWERYPDPYGESRFAETPPAPGGGPKLKEPYAREYKLAQQRKAEALQAGKPLADPSTLCVPEGMPTIMAAVEAIEILQTPRELVVLAEFLTQTRRIYLNEKMPPPEEISPGYSGYSVAHWEGLTLVIDTKGIRDDVRFVGISHSAQLKITERMRLTAPDRLEDQITLEDPNFLAEPYVFTFGYKRNPRYRILEYICDNNRVHIDPQGHVSMDVDSK